MRRTKVYIAGPMTNGHGNGYNILTIREAVLVHNRLMREGFAPFSPQLTLFAEFLDPVAYEHWLGMDLEWVAVCDVVLRMPGPSKGADREVAFANTKDIPVVYSMEELLTRFHATVQPPSIPQEVA